MSKLEDKIVQRQDGGDDSSGATVRHHTELGYCPYCEDEWCANGLRAGLEWSDIKTHVMDDRIYAAIRRRFPATLSKRHLVNVVRAGDLVKAIDAYDSVLVRPEGPKPWEEGFVAPRPSSLTDYHGVYWVSNASCSYSCLL